MKRPVLILQLGLIFFYAFQLSSCEEENVPKKEKWAVVIDFLSPDNGPYPAMKNFPIPDSLQFSLPDTLFVNQNRLPVISDSSIVYYKKHIVNGENVCCKADTLEVFSDTIQGKKYVFIIGEYIALFQSDSLGRLNPRKNIESIPLRGIRLNTPYPTAKFKDEYEKLGARLVKINERFDEVSKQKWSDNDSISVETIQFNNSEDRIITALYKDMNEKEADSTINYIRNKFPGCKYKETFEKDGNGKPLKFISISYQGVSFSFTPVNTTDYSFMMTDYYTTIKLIVYNAGTGYVFRDDVKFY